MVLPTDSKELLNLVELTERKGGGGEGREKESLREKKEREKEKRT